VNEWTLTIDLLELINVMAMKWDSFISYLQTALSYDAYQLCKSAAYDLHEQCLSNLSYDLPLFFTMQVLTNNLILPTFQQN